jgi:hypothetical protein
VPTPNRAFAAVAARRGVDAADHEAVQRWFLEDLPNLPAEQIGEILEELLAHGRQGNASRWPTCYPEGAPLPPLDGSPPAPTPLLATGWGQWFRLLVERLLRRRGK